MSDPTFTASPPAPVPDADRPRSLLEQLKADMEVEVTTPDIMVGVATRPGYTVRFATHLPFTKLAAWQARCKDKKFGPNGLDPIKLSATVIAEQCVAILKGGDEIPDPEGGAITFRSKFLWDSLGVLAARDAVMAFFGKDGLIEPTATAILTAAGYDSEVASDPTVG